MPPGITQSSKAEKNKKSPDEKSDETKPFIVNSPDGHSGPSELQDPGSHEDEFSTNTISGSLPPSFIDRLLKLACTECDTPFSSRIEDTHPYFAYCDIVCGKCTKKDAFTGTRCETYEPQCPTSVEDSGEKDFKRYDALLDLYTIIETTKTGYRCTECDKLNPFENTVRCIGADDHFDKNGKKIENFDHVVCVWCARDHHKGHLRVSLDESRDQPLQVIDNEFIRSFDSSCMKPYFLIHCASCASILFNDPPTGKKKEKPSAITISCGHLIGTNRQVCCTAYLKDPTYIIECKFCKINVPKGSEQRHFKYLNDFIGEFEPDMDCIGQCRRRHPEKNSEKSNMCIWCAIKHGQTK